MEILRIQILTFLIIIALLFIGSGSTNSSSHTDGDPLTKEQDLELLDELINSKAVPGQEILTPQTPEIKKSIKLKLKKIKKWIDEQCPYFISFNNNLTTQMGHVYSCKDNIGLDEMNLEKMNGDEVTVHVCKKENWLQAMDCMIPFIESFSFPFFRCYADVADWTIPDRTILNAQYLALKTVPRIIDSVWNLLCNYKEFLSGAFETTKNEMTDLWSNWQNKKNIQNAIAMCYIKNNQMIKGVTLCDHYAKFNYAAIIKCIMELEQFNDSESENFWNNIRLIFNFIWNKHFGGKTKATFINNIWEEFCSNESPLSYVFNTPISYGDTTQTEKDKNKKKNKTKEEL